MKSPRGFTLIEAMAAAAIAGVIIASATGAVMNINRLIADTNKKTAAWDEAKRLEEFLVAMAQGAGGGQVRPHHSIFVENASGALAPGIACRPIAGLPDCANASEGADRLTIITQDPNFPECVVTGRVGASVNVTVGDGPGAGTCCLNDSALGAGAFEDRQGLIISGGVAISVFLHNQNSAGGGCAINVPQGQAQGLLNGDLDDIATYPATLVIAKTQTFFVDRTGKDLKLWEDTDGDLQATADELTVVHDEVYDLQLAAAYDGRPEDGRLVDSNSAADEFLFNVSTDTALPASVNATQLRMLQIAVAVGTKSQVSGGNQVRLLNRPAPLSEAGVYLTATSSKAFMRNLALFTQ